MTDKLPNHHTQMKALFQVVQDLAFRILALEHQQALLHRGLLPCLSLPSFNSLHPPLAFQAYRHSAAS